LATGLGGAASGAGLAAGLLRSATGARFPAGGTGGLAARACWYAAGPRGFVAGAGEFGTGPGVL